MHLSVGTFNLNNLFSRWSFRAEVSSTDLATVAYEIDSGAATSFRRYSGKLVKGKSQGDTERIAERILRLDLDVLAIQEVEDAQTLQSFVDARLKGLYPYTVLVEGNDQRLIDVGLLSKYPIGGVTSWRHAVHPSKPGTPVFGRDLLQVEILNKTRSRRLLTIFNNHLKSHYSPWWMDADEKAEEERRSDERRRQQAEMIERIVDRQTRSNERFMVVGDMNDPPDAAPLDALAKSEKLGLVNGLANPTETRPPKPESDAANDPTVASWTHRFLQDGIPKHELLDQIWLSPNAYQRFVTAQIDRRKRHGGDGSDHDPAWVVIDV